MKKQSLRTRILLHLLDEGETTVADMSETLKAASKEVHSRISDLRRLSMIRSDGSRGGVYRLTSEGIDEALRIEGSMGRGVNKELLDVLRQVMTTYPGMIDPALRARAYTAITQAEGAL
jgi:predicted ArsR family transcriptional regulator